MKAILLLFIIIGSMNVLAAEPDPAEITIGERLFSDYRFSQFFYEKAQGNANHVLESGDPQLDFLKILDEKSSIKNPFQGTAMSCSSCHMVDQTKDTMGTRLYSDFANFSPVPLRASDPQITDTLRNTQVVLPLKPNDPNTPLFFHWDGEFNSLSQLVVGGLSGRNMGWQTTELQQAYSNIVSIIKGDDGQGDVTSEFGGYSYKELFLGEDPLIAPELRLPENLRLNVSNATDQEIVQHVAQLITLFMENIELQKNETGDFSGSPYDVFLAKNKLPTKPNSGESAFDYSQRLLSLIQSKRQELIYVTSDDGSFETHDQAFQFGKEELEGLEMFFSVPSPGQHRPSGACVQCHTPPNFTDSRFHNIGLTQLQYDRAHEPGAFLQLQVPSLEERESQRNLYALPTPEAPDRQKLLSSKPDSTDSRKADLGIWSLFANPDFPHLQSDFKTIIAQSLPDYPIKEMSDAEILPLTIGMAKTPTLRDLGHSAPYFRDGHARSIEQVLAAYIAFSMGSRHGRISPVDPKIKNIHMHGEHARMIVPFLKSLNEDYF